MADIPPSARRQKAAAWVLNATLISLHKILLQNASYSNICIKFYRDGGRYAPKRKIVFRPALLGGAKLQSIAVKLIIRAPRQAFRQKRAYGRDGVINPYDASSCCKDRCPFLIRRAPRRPRPVFSVAALYAIRLFEPLHRMTRIDASFSIEQRHADAGAYN